MDNMNNYGTSTFTQNNVTMNGGKAPGYMLWLILGIVQICSLCCCNCVMFIFGTLTVVFACIANNAFKNGDMFTYQAKLKVAKILNIIGWCIGILGWIISLVSGAATELLTYIQG